MIILLLALIILCLLLLISIVKQRQQLNRMLLTARDILEGHYNQRFRNLSHFTPIDRLCRALNEMTDRLQDAVMRSQHLEHVQKRLLSNISHDLRTPLTGLLGYVEALQKNEHMSAEEKARYIRVIAKKGNELSHLINQLYDFFLLEANEEPLKMEIINANETIKEILLLHYRSLEESGIVPDIVLPDKPVYVRGDKNALERILHNLIANAIKYGKEGKQIGIRLTEENDRALIQIWDRGEGIPEEHLPYIFERLYTGEQSRNKRFQGTGLGLAICKHLVEKHGGRLQAVSRPYEKTAFTFDLPLTKPKS